MTVFYELAMCMSQSIFPQTAVYFNLFFLQSSVHLCTVYFQHFSEVAILAAFNVSIISSTRANGAFPHPQPANDVFSLP